MVDKTYGNYEKLFYVSEEEKIEKRKAKNIKEADEKHEAEKLKRLLTDSRKPLYDAIRPIWAELKTSFEYSGLSGFEDYNQLAYNICRRHLERFFDEVDENVLAIGYEKSEKQRKEAERYGNLFN